MMEDETMMRVIREKKSKWKQGDSAVGRTFTASSKKNVWATGAGAERASTAAAPPLLWAHGMHGAGAAQATLCARPAGATTADALGE